MIQHREGTRAQCSLIDTFMMIDSLVLNKKVQSERENSERVLLRLPYS